MREWRLVAILRQPNNKGDHVEYHVTDTRAEVREVKRKVESRKEVVLTWVERATLTNFGLVWVRDDKESGSR